MLERRNQHAKLSNRKAQKTSITTSAVREMDDEHKKWPLKNWTSNFDNLKAAISRDRGRMAQDALDFGHDMGIIKKQRDAAPPVPIPWHKSECPKLLRRKMSMQE